MKITEVSIEVEASALLDCIWYADGSGGSGHAGVNLSDTPGEYRIKYLSLLDNGMVRFTLEQKDVFAARIEDEERRRSQMAAQ